MLDIVSPLHSSISNVIQVTGSNGKGSTSTLLTSMLEAHGYTVNLSINPFLFDVNEEIILRGKIISDEYSYEIKKRILDKFLSVRDTKHYKDTMYELAERRTFNYYDQRISRIDFILLRSLAILVAFAENPADFNIIEVRCGGLYDETNVFDKNQVLATIITFIQSGIGSNDKTMFIKNEKGELECSDRSMAYHKAHLGKMDTPIVISNQLDEVKREIRRVAQQDLKTTTFEYQRDWKILGETNDDFTLRCDFSSPSHPDKISDYHITKSKILFEKAQTINTATAVATLLKIYDNHLTGFKPVILSDGREFKIDIDRINDGISTATVVARPQRLLKGAIPSFFIESTKLGQIPADKIEVISGVIKLNKGGIDSIKNIIDNDNIFSTGGWKCDDSYSATVSTTEKSFFNYFIYSSGDNSANKGHKLYFFEFIQNRVLNVKDSELIIYKKGDTIYNVIKENLDSLNVPYTEKNTLSSSIVYVRNLILNRTKHDPSNIKYRVFILCDSMICFDKNIVLLNME